MVEHFMNVVRVIESGAGAALLASLELLAVMLNDRHQV